MNDSIPRPVKPIEPLKSAVAAGKGPEHPVAETRDTRFFFRIAAASTALGLGCLAATVESMRGERSGFSFEFTMGTVVAFAAGIAVGFGYWAMVARGGRTARWASVLLVAAGVGAFLYPLRFVPTNALTELARGFVPAVLALTMVGLLLRGMKRFFDADDRQADSGAEPPKDSRGHE